MKVYPKANASSRVPELDGIRGIAILMVVFYHYTTNLGTPEEGSLWMKGLFFPVHYFWSGVDLFFVLSGFLIGGIILDNHQKPFFLKTFWIRRCCRIIPLAYLVVALCFFFKSFLDGQQYQGLFDNLMPWWSYFTFTQNILMGMEGTLGGPFLQATWSLAVEDQFYLLAPIFILMLGRRRWIHSMFFIIFLAPVLRLFLSLFDGFYIWVYANMPFRMDSLAAGIIVAILFRSDIALAVMKRNRFLMFFSFVLMIFITLGMMWSQGFGQFKYSWFAFLYANFLCVALLFRGAAGTGILRLRLLTFFGAISYCLYLIHQPLNWLVHCYFNPGQLPYFFTETGVLAAGIAFALAVALSWLSFKFYERPFLRYAHGFSYEKGKLSSKQN